MNLKKQFTMGFIVAALLMITNHIALTYPSTRIAVIIFDLMMAFALIRLTYKKWKP